MKLVVALSLVTVAALAQSPLAPVPDCAVNFTFTATGTRPLFPDNGFNNRQVGCMAWTVVYTSSGFSALSLQFESAPDSSGAPGAYVAFAGTIMSGINPNTAITQAGTIFSGYFPWVRVNLTSVTGSGTITGVFYGWRNPPIPIGSSAGLPTTIQGQAADGAAVTGNPVRIAVKDGSGNTQDALGDTSGNVQVVGPAADGAALSGAPVRIGASDNTNAQNLRAADIDTFVTTNTINTGALITTKGGRVQNISAPATGSQATASFAAVASTRAVADCISFSATATTAPALTAVLVVLRDGATGAGTIIWQYNLTVSVTTGQVIAPHTFCGLNLFGSVNTAMTLEFSAGIANVAQAVNLSTYRVN